MHMLCHFVGDLQLLVKHIVALMVGFNIVSGYKQVNVEVDPGCGRK